MTLEQLRELGVEIDTKIVQASSIKEMYGQLNTIDPNHDRWTMIRTPFWIESTLVALLIKPRDDENPD